MKKCAYCGRENADDAVHCRECGTDAFKGLQAEPDGESDDTTLDDMGQEAPDVYEYIGSYPPWDARRVLDAFVEAKIRYTLHPRAGGGDAATEFGASYGSVSIGVHVDDMGEAIRIRNRVLNIQV